MISDFKKFDDDFKNLFVLHNAIKVLSQKNPPPPPPANSNVVPICSPPINTKQKVIPDPPKKKRRYRKSGKPRKKRSPNKKKKNADKPKNFQIYQPNIIMNVKQQNINCSTKTNTNVVISSPSKQNNKELKKIEKKLNIVNPDEMFLSFENESERLHKTNLAFFEVIDEERNKLLFENKPIFDEKIFTIFIDIYIKFSQFKEKQQNDWINYNNFIRGSKYKLGVFFSFIEKYMLRNKISSNITEVIFYENVNIINDELITKRINDLPENYILLNFFLLENFKIKSKLIEEKSIAIIYINNNNWEMIEMNVTKNILKNIPMIKFIIIKK